MDRRHVVPRRLYRLRRRRGAVRAHARHSVSFARRCDLRGRADRAVSRAARQFRERRIVGPPGRRTLGDDLSEWRAGPAASQSIVRSGSRRHRAVHRAGARDPLRRAEAAGIDHRHLRRRLRNGAHHQRILPRARRTARLPVARDDDGHAAVDPAAHRRAVLHLLCREASARPGELMPPSPLETEIRRRIAANGPLSVAEYMALCLSDPQYGYYTTRDPFGARGDFVTAPEVSQMFGELIGLWMAAVWREMGSPKPVHIVELGPGRGTLMSDALRAVKIVPGFREAITVHLIDISP